MSDQGLDYAFQHPSPQSIVAGGYVFVSRYLSYLNASTAPKVITAAEAHDLLAAGLDIYLNWEFDATDCLRGAAGGTADATEAVAQARALGYPAGASIYHSADFDVTDAQKPIVADYLTAARAVESAAGYRTGCYSGYWTIKYLFDNAVIDDGWQAYAWSGGLWDPRAALRQVQNGITVGGADCDRDERVGVAYSWLHPAGKPTGGDCKMYRTVVIDAALNATRNQIYLSDGMGLRVVGDPSTADYGEHAFWGSTENAYMIVGTKGRAPAGFVELVVPAGMSADQFLVQKFGDLPPAAGLVPHTHNVSATGPAVAG